MQPNSPNAEAIPFIPITLYLLVTQKNSDTHRSLADVHALLEDEVRISS